MMLTITAVTPQASEHRDQLFHMQEKVFGRWAWSKQFTLIVFVTDLAVSIQVGVETGSALPISGHVHEGGHIGVILREEDIKHEATSMVRGAFWTWYRHTHAHQIAVRDQ